MNNLARAITFFMVLVGMGVGYYLGQYAMVKRGKAKPHGAAPGSSTPAWPWPAEGPARTEAAERGKAVYIKQQCFLCHVLQGVNDLPATISPQFGPELTGVGARLDRDRLIESIVNPNAQLTQGDGLYTVDGKSRMPEYQGELKVKDLLEMVEFLAAQKAPAPPPAP